MSSSTERPPIQWTFHAREHARRECANRILADAQLELTVDAPFPDSVRFDDVRVEHERRL